MTLNPEEMLARVDFVRALARTLLGDEHLSWDVAQQAYMAAVENPPAAGIPMGAWLARIAKNLAIKLRVAEVRRAGRERAVALPDRAPSTEEVVVREEIRRKVVEAVLGLKEPYRSTLLLRFYEDLPPRKVAQAQGVSVETVKTRLKRGIEQLRIRLDATHGGDRGRWCSALLPLAGASWEGAEALALTAKAKLLGAAFLVIGASFVLWKIVEPELSGIDQRKENLVGNMQEPAPLHTEALPGSAGKERRKALTSSSRTFVSGRVLDKNAGAPVKQYFLNLWQEEAPWIWKGVALRKIRDEEGRFIIPLEEGGRFVLLIRSKGHQPLALEDFDIPDEGGLADLELELNPGFVLKGRVVDAVRGRPLPDVRVVPLEGISGSCLGGIIRKPSFGPEAYRERILFDRPDCCLYAVTDEEGRFLLSGLDSEPMRIAALSQHFAEGIAWADPKDEREVEVRLERGHSLYGRVLDEEGEPLSGAEVNLWGHVARPVITRFDGAFRTPPVKPGVAGVSVGRLPEESASFHIPSWQDCAWESRRVRVTDRDVEVILGGGSDYVTWRGTLYDAQGRPAAKGKVTASTSTRDSGLLKRIALCDEKGRFSMDKLLPGTYEVGLALPSFASDPRPSGRISFDRPGAHERDIHLFGAAMEGLVMDQATGRPLERPDCRILARTDSCSRIFNSPVDGKGRFQLLGLPPGSYTLAATGPGVVHDPLKGIEVKEREHIRGLRLEVRSGGIYTLIPVKRHPFRFTLRREGDGEPFYDGMISRDAESSRSDVFFLNLPDGDWEAHFASDTLGEGFKRFRIRPGGAVRMEINRTDFKLQKRALELSGRLFYADGRPASHLRIDFLGEDLPVPGLDKKLSVLTDGQGRFFKMGFYSGRWEAALHLLSGRTPIAIALPDVMIPEDAPDTFHHDWVVPRGRLRAKFPFDEDVPWRLTLLDKAGGRRVLFSERESSGSDLVVENLPQGELRLMLEALSYEHYEAKILIPEDGSELDLGEIPMRPAGLLVLRFEGGKGKAPGECHVEFPGREGFEAPRRITVLGLSRKGDCPVQCYSIPIPGRVSVRAGAPGFLFQQTSITVASGETVEVSLALEPDLYGDRIF